MEPPRPYTPPIGWGTVEWVAEGTTKKVQEWAYDISSADAPQLIGKHPQTLQQKRNAHITYWYLWNIPMHREPMTECGGV